MRAEPVGCSAVAGSCTRSSRTEHSQLNINSPRCQCIRRFVESVLPTTRNANGARQVNGATPADMTRFIAEPAMSMPSIGDTAAREIDRIDPE
jgi:hypothetical protein